MAKRHSSAPHPGRAHSYGIRRWIRIGPGVVLAVIAGYLVWRYDPFPARGERRAAPVRAGQKAAPNPPPPAAPGLGFLLRERDALHLSAKQVRALVALDDRWRKTTAALREALDRAAASFGGSMAERNARGETLADLQERAAAVSDYSRQLHTARRAAWEDAARHLSQDQQRQAEALWHLELSGRSG